MSPELCVHDVDLANRVTRALSSGAQFSKDATAKTRPSDIDRTTERLLRRNLPIEGVDLDFSEGELVKAEALLFRGVQGEKFGVIFKKGLSARQRNKAALNLLGQIAVGNMRDNFAVAQYPLAEADRDVDQWIGRIKDGFLKSPLKDRVFVKGITRAAI